MSHSTPLPPSSTRRPLPSSLSSNRHSNAYSPYPTSLRPSHFPSRPRFPASPAIPLSPYTSLTPAQGYPAAPAPTPASLYRPSSSLSSASRTRGRGGNPFEQLDAPAFDHFVDDIAGRIRSALAGPPKLKRVRREEKPEGEEETAAGDKEERDVFGEIRTVTAENGAEETHTSSPPHSPPKAQAPLFAPASTISASTSEVDQLDHSERPPLSPSRSVSEALVLSSDEEEEEESEMASSDSPASPSADVNQAEEGSSGTQILGRPFPSNPSLFLPSHSNSPAPPRRTAANLFDALDEGLDADDLRELEEAREEMGDDGEQEKQEEEQEREHYASFRRQDEAQEEEDQLELEEDEEEQDLPPPFGRYLQRTEAGKREQESVDDAEYDVEEEEVTTPGAEMEEQDDYDQFVPPPSQMKASRRRRYSFDEDEEEEDVSPVAASRKRNEEEPEEEDQSGEEWFGQDAGGDEDEEGEPDESRSSSEPLGTRIPYHLKGKGRAPTPPTPSSASPSLPPSSSADDDAETNSDAASDISFEEHLLPSYSLARLRSILRTLAGFAQALEEDGEGSEDGETLEMLRERMLGVERVYEERLAFERERSEEEEEESEQGNGEEAEWSEMAPSGGADMRSLLSPNPPRSRTVADTEQEPQEEDPDEGEDQGFFDPEPPSEFDIHVPSSDEDEILPPTTEDDHFPIDPASAIAERELEDEEAEMEPEERATKMQIEQLARELVEMEGRGGVRVDQRATFGGEEQGARNEEQAKMDLEAIYGDLDGEENATPSVAFHSALLFAEAQQQPHASTEEEDDLLVTSLPSAGSPPPSEFATPSQIDLAALLHSFVDPSLSADASVPTQAQTQDQNAAQGVLEGMLMDYLPTQPQDGEAQMSIEELLAAPTSSTSGMPIEQQQQEVDMFSSFPSSSFVPSSPPTTTEEVDLLVSHQPRPAQDEDELLSITTAAPSVSTQPDLCAISPSSPPAISDQADSRPDVPSSPQPQSQPSAELAPVDLTSSSPPPETAPNESASSRPARSVFHDENIQPAPEQREEKHRSPTRFQGIYSTFADANSEQDADASAEEEEEDQLASSPAPAPTAAPRGRRVAPGLRKARRSSNGGRIYSVVQAAEEGPEEGGDLLGVGDYGSESSDDAEAPQGDERAEEHEKQVLEEMVLSSSEDEIDEGQAEARSAGPSSEPMSYDESDEEELEVEQSGEGEMNEAVEDLPIAESARSPSPAPHLDTEEQLTSVPSVAEDPPLEPSAADEPLASDIPAADIQLSSAPSNANEEQVASSILDEEQPTPSITDKQRALSPADEQPAPSTTTALDHQQPAFSQIPTPYSPPRVRDVQSPGAWDPSTPIRFGPSSLPVEAEVEQIAEEAAVPEEIESMLGAVEAEDETALVGEVEEMLEEVEAEVLHDEEEAEEMVEELLEEVEELVRGELDEPLGEREQIEIDVQMDVEVTEGEDSRQADEINSVRGPSAAIEDDSDHPVVTLITEQVIITASAIEEPAEPTAESSTPRSSPPVELAPTQVSTTEELAGPTPAELSTTSPAGSPPTSTTPLLPPASTTPLDPPQSTTAFFPPPSTLPASTTPLDSPPDAVSPEAEDSPPPEQQPFEEESSTLTTEPLPLAVPSQAEGTVPEEGDETLEGPLESTTPSGTPPPALEEDRVDTTAPPPPPQPIAADSDVQQPTPPAEESSLADDPEGTSTSDVELEGPTATLDGPAAVEEDTGSSDDDSDDSLVVSSALLGSRNDTPLIAEEMATLDVDGTPPFTPFVHTPASGAAEDEQEGELVVEPIEEEMSVQTLGQDDSISTPTSDASPHLDDDSESEDELNLLPLPPATRSTKAASPSLSITIPLELASPRRSSTRLRPTPSNESLGEVEFSLQPRRSTRGRGEPVAAETSQAEDVEQPSTSSSTRRSTRLGGAADEPVASTSTSPSKPKSKRSRPSDAPTPIASPSTTSASKRRRGQDESPAAAEDAPIRPLARQHTHSNSNVLRQDPPASSTSTSTKHLPVTRSHCELHKLEFKSNTMRSPYQVAMPSCALSSQLAQETMEAFSVIDLGPLPSPSTGTRLGGAGLVDGPAADDERDVELFNGEEDVLAAVRRVAGVELYDEGAVELLSGEGGRSARSPRKRGAEEQVKGTNKKRK